MLDHVEDDLAEIFATADAPFLQDGQAPLARKIPR
jgi:hypothetical protein